MDGLHILLVEDVRDSADSMALLLQLWGYKSTAVYEGKRAVELAASLRPVVVFLAIGLPDMDGCEVARKLRGLPGMKRALLVAITGYGMEADFQRCKGAGIDLHLVKPVDPEIIRMVLGLASKRESREGEHMPAEPAGAE